MKNLIILRSTSGAGKTTFCNLIAEPKVVCCADDYFYDNDGNYKFIQTELDKAHAYSKFAFFNALKNDKIENIIVANTNCKESDFNYYVDLANKENIRVTYVVLEKRHDNSNLHNVPEHVLDRQEQFLKNSIKLR